MGWRFSVGLWDWLFGERVEIQLQTGQSRSVTKKWIEKMEQSGKMKQIDDHLIRVHILDPSAGLNHLLSEDTVRQGHYRQEFWTIGEDISEETVSTFRDSKTDSLYILMARRDGNDDVSPYILKKEIWDEAKRQMDEIG